MYAQQIASAVEWFVIISTILIILSIEIPKLFFCLSIRKVLQHVPIEKRLFPHFTIWCYLLPVVDVFLGWVLFPYGIPKELHATVSQPSTAAPEIELLKKDGLLLQILYTISFITSATYSFFNETVAIAFMLIAVLFGIAASVYWFLFWTKLVRFRKKYFQ